MVNDWSSRHYARLHSRSDSVTRLSEKSLQLLEETAGEIRISVLMRPGNEAYPPVADLLREYAANSAGVTLAFMDPDRDLAEAEALVQRTTPGNEECVVFEIGGRHSSIPADALLEYGWPDGTPGNFHPQKTFRGETLFSGAIRELTQLTRPAVYFLQGHGERSPDDFDRRTGYSRIAARLRDENVDIYTLDLGTAKAIPANCALLIVAGPVREFAPYELNLLRDHLNRKGRMLLLLDARVKTGLDPLLHDWGIQIGNDVVADENRTLGGRDLHAIAYPEHPITASLQGMATLFSLPRSLRPLGQPAGGDKPVATPIVVSSTEGWAEFDPDDASPHFDQQIDIPGPVPVAVAIERGPVPGVHVQIRPTRLVIFGDSDFASNSGLAGANADLFLNAVNWLLDRSDTQLAPGPRNADQSRIVMSAPQLHRLFLCVVISFPALLAILGLIMAWKRRH